jgi:hypothetical protein
VTNLRIHVFINRREIDLPTSPMTAEAILQAGDYGPDYELFLLHGEGDPSGGIQLERTQSLDVKNGMHFRAIPRNATFGSLAE